MCRKSCVGVIIKKSNKLLMFFENKELFLKYKSGIFYVKHPLFMKAQT